MREEEAALWYDEWLSRRQQPRRNTNTNPQEEKPASFPMPNKTFPLEKSVEKEKKQIAKKGEKKKRKKKERIVLRHSDGVARTAQRMRKWKISK